MILQLRNWHRRIFPLLGIVVGTLFVIGIARRRAIPELESLPAGVERQTQLFTATGEVRSNLFAKAPVRIRLWREQETRSLGIDFVAPRDFLKADLLAYWSAAAAARGTSAETLPLDAVMLGAFVGGPWLLPREAFGKEGCLILFSLANNEVVDVSSAIRF